MTRIPQSIQDPCVKRKATGKGENRTTWTEYEHTFTTKTGADGFTYTSCSKCGATPMKT